MSLAWRDSVGLIPGVGAVTQAALARLNICTIGDLLRWYPRQYLDASQPMPIREVPYNRLVAVEATVLSVDLRRTKSRGIMMLEAKVEDESGEMLLRWFSQPFLRQKLVPGSRFVFIGQANRLTGQLVMMSPLIEDVPRILSIYGQTKGLTSKMLRNFIDLALRRTELADPLPEPVRQEAGVLSLSTALSALHQPKTVADTEAGRERAAFEEVFWFFLRMAAARRDMESQAGIPLPLDQDFLRERVGALPFELTPGQKRAVWDVVQEMRSGSPMTRLLNGDVGSGKTAVAALVASSVVHAGYQSVILVPTEILAKQHALSISRLLEGSGQGVRVWTAAQKDDLEGADIIVGTHAVLAESFALPRLALVVIDEQHRFGVGQRQKLRSGQGRVPHILSMTATPIPRTLALALYGDLTVSFLPDKPKDRLPIITEIIQPSSRNVLHRRLVDEIAAGHQAFVICPLIEEKKAKEAEGEPTLFVALEPEERDRKEQKTVKAELERLRGEYPDFRIEAVHGKLKAEEKRRVMERMAAGEIDILVATSVIEVGVDVPNATVMVIEGAERFGLAQLHQFRGRIGRGSVQSYCFLCPEVRNEEVMARLGVLAEHDSGFRIAEADLALRGPGELAGQVQSGLPDFRMASLTDLEFLSRVKGIADSYVREHPDFEALLTGSGYSSFSGGLE